jgi:uncharacterized protein (TIGR03067 family)
MNHWSKLVLAWCAVLALGVVMGGRPALGERSAEKKTGELTPPAPPIPSIKGALLATLRGHTADVRSVAFAPDGKTLATASFDQTVKLWDLPSGKDRATLEGHTDKVNCVVFSPDGKTLATAGLDGIVKLWDVATAKELATLKGHQGWVTAAAFTPDGKTLASASTDRTIKIWQIATQSEQATLQGHTAEVESVSFSPDGKTLASGSWDGNVRLWDTATWKQQTSLPAHAQMVTGVTFTPDSKILVTAAGPDRVIKLWDMGTGKLLDDTMQQPQWLRSLAISPDGKTLATTCLDGRAYLWDRDARRNFDTLQAHRGQAWNVAFSPDGKTLASAGHQQTVKLWDIRPGPRQLAFDDFQQEFNLDWQIRHADLSHISLTKRPGTLTICTQEGGFYGSARTFRNLVLLDNPAGDSGDFAVTTCLVSFEPVGSYHQAGLVCFDDEDNYLKFTWEWGGQDQPRLALVRETQGTPGPHAYVPDVPQAERLWLRLTKRGSYYNFSSSTDGKSYRAHGELPWGDGAPKHVGLVAKNGGSSEAPEIDASFDLFEVRSLTPEEENDPLHLERQKLQGTWKVVSCRRGGEPVEQPPLSHFAFAGGKLTITEEPARAAETEYTLDVAGRPKQILLTTLEGRSVEPLRCAYSLEGDTLTICFDPRPGAPPPPELQTTKDDQRLLVVLKRVAKENQ